MWQEIQLPAGWGVILIDRQSLITDEELMRIPDTSVRADITAIARQRACGRQLEPFLQFIASCDEHIAKKRMAADVANLHPLEARKFIDGWERLRTLARVAADQIITRNAAWIDETYVNTLLHRWLLLRMAAIGAGEGVHNLEGYFVKDGIIEPKPGGKR